MSKERVEIERIEPKRAAEMLKSIVPGQRTLNKARVETYARAFRAGRAPVMWDCIALNDRGQVANGVHRLNAIVKSGKAIRTPIMYNVSQEAIDLGDQGQVRTIEQTLKRHGEAQPGTLATALRMLTRWLHGLGPGDRRYPVSWSDAEQTLYEHPDLRDHTLTGRDLRKHGALGSDGLGAMLAYLFSQVDPARGPAFLGSWISDEIKGGRDPVHHLRTWLIANQPRPGAKGSGLDTDDKAANAIIAFNLWRRGEQPERMALWRSNYRKSKPDFPMIEPAQGWVPENSEHLRRFVLLEDQ